MFYLVTHYLSKVGTIFRRLSNITWNFSEAGHGKGVPDGIGGFLKKLLDDLIRRGIDIPDFNVLVDELKDRVTSVFISTVSNQEIESVRRSRTNV